MSEHSYRQFCPVAMAAEILCARWTIIVLRELAFGSTRFNELRRGVPRMSPTLLSQRLKELEKAGIVERFQCGQGGTPAYRLTEAGREIEEIIVSFGRWGQRWVGAEPTLQQLDASLLMWDMRRRLVTDPMPDGRSVLLFQFPEQPAPDRKWWLVVHPDQPVELCWVDPGFAVNLFVSCDLRTLTAIWLGLDSVDGAQADGRLFLTGDHDLAEKMPLWLGYSSFATEAKLAS